MLCSLREYKGVNEFVNLAYSLANNTFTLVLNASQKEINNYFNRQKLPNNIKIYPAQSDVHPFYQNSHLILNLSHPLKWVENFAGFH